MDQRIDSERLMIRYLLGELSNEEQIELETEYFTDPERFDMLQAVEHDLAEGYVSGKLSIADREKFERHYLTVPARRDYLRFFQTLAKTVPLEPIQHVPPPLPMMTAAGSVNSWQPNSWWPWLIRFRWPPLALRLSFGIAVLILAAGGILQTMEIARLRQELTRTERESADVQERERELKRQIDAQQAQNAQLTQELQSVHEKLTSLSTPAPIPEMVSLAWTISNLRDLNPNGNAPRTLRISPGVNLVELTFNLPAARDSHYSVTLQSLAGEEIWNRGEIKAIPAKSGLSLVLRVPAKEFQKGAYSLVLRGKNAGGESIEIGEFHLEVK